MADKIMSELPVNTNVRQKEMIAEIFPLDKAVKNPDVVILIPLKKKIKCKNFKTFYS